MKVRFRWNESEFAVRDLVLAAEHCEQLYIDGDTNTVVLVNPDEWIIEELKNRGIKVEVVE